MIEFSANNISDSGANVTILYEGEDKPCYMHITISSITKIDQVFPNTRVLSAHLRDTLSYIAMHLIV